MKVVNVIFAIIYIVFLFFWVFLLKNKPNKNKKKDKNIIKYMDDYNVFIWGMIIQCIFIIIACFYYNGSIAAIAAIPFTIILVLSLIFKLLEKNWKIIVLDESCIYINIFGKKREYFYNEITLENHKVIDYYLCKDGKRLFKVTGNFKINSKCLMSKYKMYKNNK